jgi:hypothetical protein
MTEQLTVRADADAEPAGAVAAVVSSLPVSLKPAVNTADVVAVDGSAGWSGRAAEELRNGAQGVVVISPAAEDTAALADSTNAVVLDQQWAGNPALADSQTNVRAVLNGALAEAVLVDSVAYASPGSDPDALLTEHLAVILKCGLEGREWQAVQRNRHGYVVMARLSNGAPVALQGILTSSVPANAKVSILTASGRADVVLPDPSAAWPAEVRSVTADGATTLPTLYETAHRHTWTRLRDQLASGVTGSDLEQFAVLTSLVRQLTT